MLLLSSQKIKRKTKSLSCFSSGDLTIIHTMNLVTLESCLFSRRVFIGCDTEVLWAACSWAGLRHPFIWTATSPWYPRRCSMSNVLTLTRQSRNISDTETINSGFDSVLMEDYDGYQVTMFWWNSSKKLFFGYIWFNVLTEVSIYCIKYQIEWIKYCIVDYACELLASNLK